MVMRTKIVLSIIAVVGLVAGCAGCSTDGDSSLAGQTAAPAATPHGQARPAPGGKPVAGQQKAPAVKNGKVAVVDRIKTTKPYVFITIDDGQITEPHALELIKKSGLRPVLFLNNKYVKKNPKYFKDILDQTGAVIGDHTVDHPNLPGKPLAFQQKEICDDANDFQTELGRRPVLFRPPYGNYDANTLKAAANCHMKVAVLWTAEIDNGVVEFQRGHTLRPGDIVLMHFRHTFVEDYRAFLAQAKRDHLTPMPLADFLA